MRENLKDFIVLALCTIGLIFIARHLWNSSFGISVCILIICGIIWMDAILIHLEFKNKKIIGRGKNG